jgi:hypothetical protein
MQKISRWGKAVTVVALVLNAGGNLQAATPVINRTTDNIIQTSDSLQLAQGLVGQCRTAKQSTIVYTQRSASSPTVRTLAANEQVILGDNGGGGWIAINSPSKGFVQARDLASCSGVVAKPPIPTTVGTSLCRLVTYPTGLVIRNDPDGAVIDGVATGQKVALTNPLQTKKDKLGRTWVNISAPKSGWISLGVQPNGGTNITACP